MWEKIASFFGGSVFTGVTSLIEQFHMSPEDKAKLDVALRETEVRLEMAVALAAAETIKAEAQSGDSFVCRARPTFLYLMYGVLSYNFVVVPTVQMFQGAAMSPLDLPTDLYYLFGAGFLGYTGARSWDKAKGYLLAGKGSNGSKD